MGKNEENRKKSTPTASAMPTAALGVAPNPNRKKRSGRTGPTRPAPPSPHASIPRTTRLHRCAAAATCPPRAPPLPHHRPDRAISSPAARARADPAANRAAARPCRLLSEPRRPSPPLPRRPLLAAHRGRGRTRPGLLLPPPRGQRA